MFTSSVRERTPAGEHSKKTKLRNMMKMSEERCHTHSLSKEHDIRLHQSPALVASRDLVFLDQLSNLGGIERRLAIDATL